MTNTQIHTTVYRCRPPRRSLMAVRLIWASAIVVLAAILAVGYVVNWTIF